MQTVTHDKGKRRNNRIEVLHRTTKQQERQIRRLKSMAQAQHFIPTHAPINNLFRARFIYWRLNIIVSSENRLF